MAPLLAEHLAGLMQNCRQNPLSVAEKIDTGPSSFTAFSPQDDKFYLLSFVIRAKTYYNFVFRKRGGELGCGCDL